MDWTHHVEFLAIIITLIGGFYVIDGKFERHAERTDKLYEMFIDLLKEKK